ncbi:MAG: hypothetical protein PHU54_09410 [Candidatus Omnitrophica bacterium]|nr:hypothetical protein [Candidatus Omnitrophota bacterium]
MPDDIEQVDAQESEEDYIARILGEDEVEEPHAEEVEEAEAKFDKAEEKDRFAKKAESKLEAFEKKFEKTMLTSALDRFMDKSDDLEKSLMRELAGDVKSLGDFERAEKIVKAQADKLRTKSQEYEEQAQEAARNKAANAWGVTPQSRLAPPPDENDELMKRISNGDVSALVESVIGDDLPY